MKKKLRKNKLIGKILIIIIILIIVIFLSILIKLKYADKSKITSCEDVEENAEFGELTFVQSYCGGNYCNTFCVEDGDECWFITTKEECEKIDVVSELDISKWNPDSLPDCQWLGGKNPLNMCKPNK